ncbi:cas scaffolding protein family member 4 isoform X2 [Pithys albifrons albifrons]|uniref:cas scaffolding protein family member 4 isoform X2 n=1 Tax=Pithys albifrons albifrons TaxID=3385563 RepID=UPI003A5CF00D
MKVTNTLAKALYDNKAECSDELAFRKGDILTVLEQHVLGSEGWWKCSLHGRQGLAPANRLQLLSPATPLPPSTRNDPTELPAGQQNIYQVPSVPKPTVLSATYEKMEGWVKSPARGSAMPAQAIYQVPALAAQLLSERTKRSTHQHLFTLPRACRASAPNIRSEVYDVPSTQRLLAQSGATPPTTRKGSVPLRSTESFQAEQKQLYNIPPSPEKPGAGIHTDSPAGNLYDVPPKREIDASESRSQKKCWGHYNTLPNPRKSEWIYDIPVSPEKSGLKQNPSGHSLENHMLYDIPPARYKVPTTNGEAKVVNPQLYDVPPTQRKLTLPDICLYDVPSSRDVLLLPQNSSCDVPSSLLAPKAESQISEGNVYDIPKGFPSTGQSKKEIKNSDSSREQAHGASPKLLRDAKLEQESSSVPGVDSSSSTLSTSSSSSVPGVDSRSSTLSTSSSSSAELFSMSLPSEEPEKEIKVDLEVAIETLTRLQHSVSSSVASLMIFVSSKWRLKEHLEKSIKEIHRAIDHIKVSLGEFLAFAQAIKGNASHLTDNNLQTRIIKQLEILVNSFTILTETREALNNCNWSLEALVLRKPQNNPDDLDRFVMVARTIPDDIKRFVSIIIANGKLLFRKKEKDHEMKQTKVNPEYKMAKQIPVARRIEIESLQRSAADQPNQGQVPLEKQQENSTEDCDYVQLQAQKIISGKEVAKKSTDSKPQALPTEKKAGIPSKQDCAKKIPLPEHCRLCFAALHKAIGVFTHSLNNNQPPEVFISHSKLIIMVGQKLVDSLCQETQGRDVRSDVLHSSSRFCSLLKNLALATKNAAMKYPNADATRELRDQTEELSKYTLQFRAMME